MAIRNIDQIQSSPLDDTRLRLEAVLNNATVAILLMNDQHRCVYMNRAAEQLTGYSLDEVIALDRPLHDIVHHTHPDGSPFPLQDCPIDRAFPEENQMQAEEVFVHRDGSFYPVAFTASPMRDERSRTVGTVIELRSITAERQARERQRLLTNELNHRVKNTLATVQSIAWQSFKHAAPEALSDFNGRIAILARAHNLLTEAAWATASLTGVVRMALEPFGSAQIDAQGPDCVLHPKVAVSLSMVLHELGTNALKYGALKTDAGRIGLRWSHALVDGGIQLRMTWTESGGPEVAPPESRGFGTRLIERQLAMEFGGQAELLFRSEGLVCNMKLNLPTLSEQWAYDKVAPSA